VTIITTIHTQRPMLLYVYQFYPGTTSTSVPLLSRHSQRVLRSFLAPPLRVTEAPSRPWGRAGKEAVPIRVPGCPWARALRPRTPAASTRWSTCGPSKPTSASRPDDEAHRVELSRSDDTKLDVVRRRLEDDMVPRMFISSEADDSTATFGHMHFGRRLAVQGGVRGR
jgi:hypothetical protein